MRVALLFLAVLTVVLVTHNVNAWRMRIRLRRPLDKVVAIAAKHKCGCQFQIDQKGYCRCGGKRSLTKRDSETDCGENVYFGEGNSVKDAGAAIAEAMEQALKKCP